MEAAEADVVDVEAEDRATPLVLAEVPFSKIGVKGAGISVAGEVIGEGLVTGEAVTGDPEAAPMIGMIGEALERGDQAALMSVRVLGG